MSSYIEENWILNAHPKIKEIFDECQKNKEDWTVKLDKFFEEEVSKCYDQLPWLNETPLHNLQSNQIVRFRGMIQDMHDPEFYMDTYIIKNSDGTEMQRPGKYLDVVSCSANEEILINSPNCETKDRNSYFCISLPGEAEWVKEFYVSQNEKLGGTSSSQNINEVKRKREMDEEEDNENSMDVTKPTIETGKRLKESSTSQNGNQSKNFSSLKTSKFPFPDTEGVACLLKVYDSKVDFLLNDVIEAVGILSLDPIMSDNGVEDNSLFGKELDQSLPPSLAPRLHVVSLKKKAHCNPLLPLTLGVDDFAVSSTRLRELFSSVLDVAFLGDELAAEYFICHLISSVYLRQDIMPLGKFSINLSGITQELQAKNYPQLLYKLLHTLATHSHFLAMTLDHMNKREFIPKKDYQENSLRSGFLQLPANLHLVVDETQLTAGQLDNKGVTNLTALGTLINWQKVDYDFQFHSLEQHTNVPVFILSEGRAMINSDFQIKLDPKHTDVSDAFNQVWSLLTRQSTEELRSYITLSRRTQYTLSDNMQKTVQDDFVSSRRHEDGMSADDLHSLLTLAKLMAQSCGKLELTEDIWKSVKMLEVERKGRIREQPARA